MKTRLINQISSMEKFFVTSTRCLTESNSGFRPTPETFSVAEQFAHAAQTIEWFTDALGNPKGFDLNFEAHAAEVKKCQSLTEARAWFSKAIQAAHEALEGFSESELNDPLPMGPIMGGAPRYSIVIAMCDHTAHHRGALTVYSRLLGLVPDMPYGD